MHQHATASRDRNTGREHEDLDTSDQKNGKEAQSSGALRGLVPSWAMLVAHVGDDDGHEAADKY